MMKRFAALWMVLVLVLTGMAFAENLAAAIASAKEEVAGAAGEDAVVAEEDAVVAEDGVVVIAKDAVVFEQNDVQVYLTGESKVWGSDTVYLDLEAVVVNGCSSSVTVSVEECSINGWDIYASGIYDTSAGKKKKDELTFNLSDAEISSIEEIEEIEIAFRVYDSDSYDDLFTTDIIVLKF